MSRSFHITTPSESLQLDGSCQGEISFTVSNALGKLVWSRAVLEPRDRLSKRGCPSLARLSGSSPSMAPSPMR